MSEQSWFVYVLRCRGGSLYTGITTDLERRVIEHNEDDRLGAKYTRARRPVRLVYSESFTTRAEAARREWEIKRYSKTGKEALIAVGARPVVSSG